jgi:hypothetical protein
MDSSINNILSDIYYNTSNPGSFGGIQKLYKSAKLNNNNISLLDVKNWLKSQPTYTLHKPARRKYPRNKIYVSYIDEQWEADLIDLQKLSYYNQSFKYILNVIDCFSKYLFAVPLKTKKPNEIIKAFKTIIKTRKPTKLRTDKGLEFENKHFKKFCKDNEIIYFTTTNSTIKCAIVERVNRTIKEKMFRQLTNNLSKNWKSILPNIVKTYNSSVHKSTGFAPSEVNYTNESIVRENLYGNSSFTKLFNNRYTPKLNIGDSVRVKYDLKSMDKSFYPLWTDTIYTIKKVLTKHNKPLYIIEFDNVPLIRRFYETELQKVHVDNNTLWRIESIIKYRTINGEKQAYIKWLGYPETHNSWIPLKEIRK